MVWTDCGFTTATDLRLLRSLGWCVAGTEHSRLGDEIVLGEVRPGIVVILADSGVLEVLNLVVLAMGVHPFAVFLN